MLFVGRVSPAALRIALAAVCCTSACAATSPPSTPVAEPTRALRPPDKRGTVPEDARVADYRIEAKLDAETHELQGKLRLHWRNATQRTVSSMPFHLYMNAFRAEDTTWMLEARGRHRSSKLSDDSPWGYVDVTSVRSGDAALKFREDTDPTVMLVDLPQPVGPGQSIDIDIEFLTKLPRVFARTGHAGDFHMVGQWFPKVGVLEEQAGWQNHVFHLHSEFYADFGNYDVILDVPDDMVVGASGIRVAERTADGRTTLEYRAEMVHDFAWTCSPHYVEHFGDYHGIRIRQLLQPEHAADAERHLEAQKLSLASFEDRYGPYPWSTITIVHVPKDATGAGGMEYPTLYTTSDIAPVPSLVRNTIFDERVSGVFTTIHEFGHQYFQGLFASNEHTQPWLDEGLNSMADMLAYYDAYGEDPWLIRLGAHEFHASDASRLPSRVTTRVDKLDQPANAFSALVGSYGSLVYQKTAGTMLQLRRLVGDAAFRKAMTAYAERARFRHPTGDDLVEAFIDALGPRVAVSEAGDGAAPVQLDLREYFAQSLHETTSLNFSLYKVTNVRMPGKSGWHRDAQGKLVGGEAPEDFDTPVADLDDARVEGIVIVHREGEFRVPVEVLVEFTDDTRERIAWDGQQRHRIFTFPGKRIRFAALDPEDKLMLERTRLDNAMFASTADRVPRLLEDASSSWVQALSLAMMGAVGP